MLLKMKDLKQLLYEIKKLRVITKRSLEKVDFSKRRRETIKVMANREKAR
jgi:hypothetical protein